MFEQAVLRPEPVRSWAVTLGFAGELVLVGCVLAVPLIWPQLLPRAETTAWIFAPTPPPVAFKPAEVPRMRVIREWHPTGVSMYLPAATQPAIFDNPPVEEQGPGVIGGSDVTGPGDRLSFLDPVIRIAAPKPAAELTFASVAKPAPAPTRSVRVSGSVEAALLVHRVDPVYPPIAQKMRISGTVELAGVIGTDGRIRELRVTSGHPFLAQAALDAVRQWVYQPTLLSGAPVEVITTISVVFRLN